jgi:hypothetical protein
MTSPQETLTASQRDEIRQHILHEWQMVRCAVQALIDSLLGDMQLSRFLHEATLDSLLLHARSLYDFFKGPVKFSTDVKAQHLLPAQQRDWEPSGLESLAASIGDINKLSGHLTWDRLDRSASWPVTAILQEVNSAFNQFIERLPVDEQQLWRA